MDEECQKLFHEKEVPIGYQQQERYHEYILRMLREERENNSK